MPPLRLAYQPPAINTFISEQISHSNQPAVLFSHNNPAPAISHQPNEQGLHSLTNLRCPHPLALGLTVERYGANTERTKGGGGSIYIAV
jgi:hypothetical protein